MLLCVPVRPLLAHAAVRVAGMKGDCRRRYGSEQMDQMIRPQDLERHSAWPVVDFGSRSCCSMNTGGASRCSSSAALLLQRSQHVSMMPLLSNCFAFRLVTHLACWARGGLGVMDKADLG
jgi:hypothetical protein